MAFRFRGNQRVWIAENGQPATIIGRAGATSVKENQYYIRSNAGKDWVDESSITDVDPSSERVRREPGVRGMKIRSIF